MSRSRRARVALATLVILSGCQRHLIPTPNLYADSEIDPFADVPPELATSTVDLLYVTDRKPEGDGENDPGDVEYGYGRSFSVAVGSCVVEIGNGVPWEELVKASRVKKRGGTLPLRMRTITEQFRFPPTPISVNKGGEVEATSQYVVARQAAVDALHDELRRRLAVTPRKEAYVFVHGYANTFRKAAFRMAEMWHFLGREGVPILYSWPAGYPGLLRGYTHDRESGEFTIFHLKEFLKALAACPELDTVHVIAHSLGTDVAMVTPARRIHVLCWSAGGRVTTRALTTLRERHPDEDEDDLRARLRIGTVYFAAADVPRAELFDALPVFHPLVDRVVVTVSSHDDALGMSARIMGGGTRIGQASAPLAPEQVALLESYERLEVVHVSLGHEQRGFDITGHRYWFRHPWASSDVILSIRGDLPPRRRGLEQGTSPVLWYMPADYPSRLRKSLSSVTPMQESVP